MLSDETRACNRGDNRRTKAEKLITFKLLGRKQVLLWQSLIVLAGDKVERDEKTGTKSAYNNVRVVARLVPISMQPLENSADSLISLRLFFLNTSNDQQINSWLKMAELKILQSAPSTQLI